MTATDLPPRRALYFLNPTPPPVLTPAQLAALDKDPEPAPSLAAMLADAGGVALVQTIIERKDAKCR